MSETSASGPPACRFAFDCAVWQSSDFRKKRRGSLQMSGEIATKAVLDWLESEVTLWHSQAPSIYSLSLFRQSGGISFFLLNGAVHQSATFAKVPARSTMSIVVDPLRMVSPQRRLFLISVNSRAGLPLLHSLTPIRSLRSNRPTIPLRCGT
jgi:hypothetical protein